MVRVAAVTALALTLGCATGCSSIEHALLDDRPFEMYGGTSNSMKVIRGDDPEADGWGVLAYSIDFPFTVVMDTLLLPISAPVELTR